MMMSDWDMFRHENDAEPPNAAVRMGAAERSASLWLLLVK